MDAVYAVVGLLVGIALTFLWSRAQLAKLQAESAAKVAQLETESATKLAQAAAESAAKLAQAESESQTKLIQAESASKSREAALNATLETQKAAYVAQEKKLNETFTTLSQQALEQASNQFLKLANQNFETAKTAADGDLKRRQQAVEELVKPLREELDRLAKQNAEIEQKRLSAYDGITDHLKRLMTETGQLTNALRRPHTRGSWGELTLRRAAENAGLVEGQDFTLQTSTETDEGRLRPDMLVNLPNDRVIVVDCKTPLDAYLDAVGAVDETEKALKLKAHASQVRKHIQQLSSKAYWQQFETAPDFVVMFVPSESLYQAAMEQDPELFETAFRSRVVLANPMTLIALLRTVAAAMEQEKLKQNAQEISRTGARLYEGLRTFATHVTKVGRHLKQTTEAYNDAVGSLERTVLVRSRQLKEMGAGGGDEPALPDVVEVVPRKIQAQELLGLDD